MPTLVYELNNTAVPGQKIRSADWNDLADAIETIGVESAEFSGGGGFLEADDFAIASTSGLNVTCNGGRVIGGAAGQRQYVRNDDQQVVACTNGATNYGYVKLDGTFEVVTNPMSASAGSKLAWTAVASGGNITSYDNLPDGRVNLIGWSAVKVSSDDEQADYLENKIAAGTGVSIAVTNNGANEQLTITASNVPTTVTLDDFDVDLQDGEDCLLEIDFSGVGSFTGGRFWVNVAVEDAGSVVIPGEDLVVTETLNERGASSVKLLVQVGDSGLGSASNPVETCTFTVTLTGFNYTAAGGTAATVAKLPFDGAVSPSLIRLLGTSTTRTLTVAVGSTIPVGSRVVVAVMKNDTDLLDESVTDDAGNTYVLEEQQYDAATAAVVGIYSSHTEFALAATDQIVHGDGLAGGMVAAAFQDVAQTAYRLPNHAIWWNGSGTAVLSGSLKAGPDELVVAAVAQDANNNLTPTDPWEGGSPDSFKAVPASGIGCVHLLYRTVFSEQWLPVQGTYAAGGDHCGVAIGLAGREE